MSRIGNKPISVPDKVKVQIKATELVVTGPKGTLTSPIPPGIGCKQKDNNLVLTRSNDSGSQRSFHGLARALASNAVRGVTEGFKKDLEIVGVGFRVELRRTSLIFSLGFSHPIEYPLPEGIEAKVEKQTNISISGNDRQQVGQVAATIRSLKKPDPYKNKGIRYVGEVLKKKAGKTAGSAA